jgi:hypothetical protein
VRRLRPTSRVLLLGGIAAVAVIVCVPLLQRLREPVYQGRRVGAWFADLCTGAFAPLNANRCSAASAAFSRMDSNAVPFLVKQLSYDQSGTIERLELAVLRVRLVSTLAMPLAIPSEQRKYAAVALGAMGTNAISALEPMLAAYVS